MNERVPDLKEQRNEMSDEDAVTLYVKEILALGWALQEKEHGEKPVTYPNTRMMSRRRQERVDPGVPLPPVNLVVED